MHKEKVLIDYENLDIAIDNYFHVKKEFTKMPNEKTYLALKNAFKFYEEYRNIYLSNIPKKMTDEFQDDIIKKVTNKSLPNFRPIWFFEKALKENAEKQNFDDERSFWYA